MDVGTKQTNTMELEVENASFMLDTLGKDCEPLQFLRELTENAVQAVQSNGKGSGEVIWDVDWTTQDADGLWKLSCVDTGLGMTADELKRYINHLSASRHAQSIRGNFGIGAKVSAAPLNPHGIVYLSWKDGDGSMVQLWRDPETKNWGLKQFEIAPGRFDFSISLDDSVKPDQLSGHDCGTMVVLLGDSAEDNTLDPPAGIENRHKWIPKYLNQRYFRFPAGVNVKVREGWEFPRGDSRNFLRQVHGQERFLQRSSLSAGEVPLQGATARWWILDDKHDGRSRDALWASTGHRAALYQDELYELALPSRGGYRKVQEFGVRFAYSRVVIYVEPSESEGRAMSSTSRSELKLDGMPLPWSAWGEEFANKLPDEIKALEEELAASTVDDHRHSIRKRLEPILELFKRRFYRPREDGAKTVGPASVGGEASESESTNSGRAMPGTDGGRDGNIYSLFQVEKGTPASEVKADNLPRITWVSTRHDPPTRTAPHLEDRAARFDSKGNRLEINEDFGVFQDTMNRWAKRYEEVPGAKAIVESRVREWYGQVLTETVLGSQMLRGSKYWDDQGLEVLLSEEALTAVVQPRYFIEQRLKQDLGQLLGRHASRNLALLAIAN